MKINITKKIGNSSFTFQVDESKDIDALAKAGFLASMPSRCDSCGSPDVHLSANRATTDKGSFVFVKVICNQCNARSDMGQYKAGGFFFKQWEKYQSPGQRQNQGQGQVPTQQTQQTQQKQESQPEGEENINVEEIPF